MRSTIAFVAGLALLASLASPASADPVVDVFTGNIHVGSPQDGGVNTDGKGRQTFDFQTGITLGSNFTANREILIHQVGIWDDNGDGLLSDHKVLVFDHSDPFTPLASLDTVAGGGDLRGGYRYFDLDAPIVIEKETTFQVGVFYGPGNEDSNGNAGSLGQNLEPRPTFHSPEGRVTLGPVSHFGFGAEIATIPDSTGDRYHAASFRYTPNPEPGTMVLLSGVFGAAVVYRRRKKRLGNA